MYDPLSKLFVYVEQWGIILYYVVIFICTGPTGGPQAFVASVKFSTNITVQWQRVICSERNSEITHYLLRYSLVGNNDIIKEVKVLGTDDSNRTYTANRLQPLSEYIFTIAAVNSGGQRGPSTAFTAITSVPESEIILVLLNVSKI